MRWFRGRKTERNSGVFDSTGGSELVCEMIILETCVSDDVKHLAYFKFARMCCCCDVSHVSHVSDSCECG